MNEKIAGMLACGAFLLVSAIGIFFEQPIEDIMLKASIAMVAFYLLGFFFAELGTSIVLEKFEHFDADKWEDSEGKKLEEKWKKDPENVMKEMMEMKPTKLISVDTIRKGMVLAKSVVDENKKIVLKAGFELSPTWKARLKNRGITRVYIYSDRKVKK